MHERSGKKSTLSDYELQLAKAEMMMNKLEKLEIESYGELKKAKCGCSLENHQRNVERDFIAEFSKMGRVTKRKWRSFFMAK
eukprot:XP_002258680.1 hypothetical protein, conserved in Plasmodium species [Plasmodium knowlesi strain H]